jgi:hypothetical protein
MLAAEVGGLPLTNCVFMGMVCLDPQRALPASCFLTESPAVHTCSSVFAKFRSVVRCCAVLCCAAPSQHALRCLPVQRYAPCSLNLKGAGEQT